MKGRERFVEVHEAALGVGDEHGVRHAGQGSFELRSAVARRLLGGGARLDARGLASFPTRQRSLALPGQLAHRDECPGSAVEGHRVDATLPPGLAPSNASRVAREVYVMPGARSLVQRECGLAAVDAEERDVPTDDVLEPRSGRAEPLPVHAQHRRVRRHQAAAHLRVLEQVVEERPDATATRLFHVPPEHGETLPRCKACGPLRVRADPARLRLLGAFARRRADQVTCGVLRSPRGRRSRARTLRTGRVTGFAGRGEDRPRQRSEARTAHAGEQLRSLRSCSFGG
jgi:hypothetical protein